jgi:uncharacterized protein (DUF433 family)
MAFNSLPIAKMQKIDFRNIEKIPDRCGGKPVIAGTRIRVSLILRSHRTGMSIEEILQQYPHLRPSDVHDALAYAYDHPVEMEDEIAADSEDVVKRRIPGGPSQQ